MYISSVIYILCTLLLINIVVLTADKGLGNISRGFAVYNFPDILIKKLNKRLEER